MLFKDVVYLKNSVEEYREKMKQSARDRGINHPDTIKFSQELDIKIVELQKYLFQTC
jgi:Spo0E like sporulation regulatory protein